MYQPVYIIFSCEQEMSKEPKSLCPTHREKTSSTMKAPHAVKHITFNPSDASPGKMLYVHEPKLNKQGTCARLTGASL